MIGKDGRLAVPLASPNSSFATPCILELSTGRITRVPAEHYFDYGSMEQHHSVARGS